MVGALMSQVENYLSFPGLGIGERFHMDKLIPLFGGKFHIAWYGILVTLGMVAAFLYTLYRTRKLGIKSDDIVDVALFTVLFGVIGARLYYVIFSWSDYLVVAGTVWERISGTFLNIIAIWNGGLAIPGGLIAGAITVIIVCRVKKIRLLLLLDAIVPGVMLGQAIGRWGNFVNVEAFGSETTLPWRMGIARMYEGTMLSETFVHPTFLYECLWNLLGFFLLNLLYKRRKCYGQVTLGYFIWYGIGRMLIEQLRTDALMWGPIRVTQLLCALVSVTGIVLLCLLSRKTPAFARLTAGEAAPENAPSSSSIPEEKEDKTDTNDTQEAPASAEGEQHGKTD